MADLNLDWSKITQPILFFGLTDNFELDELKKVYKTYIKTFKPDSFPEEFKKIRHAYEMLLERINFNIFEKNLEELELNKISEIKSDEPHATDESNQFKSLSDNDYQNLASVKDSLLKMPLNARTCLYWAAYSDLEVTDQDHFYWLMKGAQYIDINDYYYGTFLSQFVRSCHAEESWCDVLPTLAKELKANVFYYYLYPIFDQMNKDLKAQTVTQCLIDCEKKLIYVGDYLDHKLDLYLLLLNKCILTGKAEFYMHLVDFLQIHKAKLHDDQYSSLEFSLNLIEYSNEKNNILPDHVLGRKFDAIIDSYVAHNEEQSRELSLDLKRYFKNNLKFDDYLNSEAFNRYCDCTFKVMGYIINDLTHILNIKDYDNKIIIKNALSFNDVIVKKYRYSIRNFFFNITHFFFMQYLAATVSCLLLILAVIFLAFEFNFIIYGLIIILTVTCGFMGQNRIKGYFHLWAHHNDEIIYHQKIQKKIFDLIYSKEILTEHISLLPEIINDIKKLKNTKKIFDRISNEKLYKIHDLFARIS